MYKYQMILILALASLACLETTMTIPTAAPEPTPTAMLDEEPYSGVVFEMLTQGPAKECAIVTANQSLWLREQPSEKSKAISWLPANEIVQVIGKVGKWWKIESAVGTGYAKADYLQESECE